MWCQRVPKAWDQCCEHAPCSITLTHLAAFDSKLCGIRNGHALSSRIVFERLGGPVLGEYRRTLAVQIFCLL